MRISIVGAGAAGLMAAISAAKVGADEVFLFDSMESCGKKLLITGNGRCNVTNINADKNIDIGYFSGGRFLMSAFSRFSQMELMEFLENLGIPLKTEDNGKVFPRSDKASQVVDTLADQARALGIRFFMRTKILDIQRAENGFLLISNEQRIRSDKVILTTGGKSFPNTGSDGSGYSLAEGLGHAIMPLGPGLTALFTDAERTASLMGVTLPFCAAFLSVNGQAVQKEFGAVLFTHFGISGPAIFRLSRALPDEAALYRNQVVEVVLDFAPERSREELEALFTERIKDAPKRLFCHSLKGLWSESFLAYLAETAKLPVDLRSSSVTRRQRKALVDAIKNFTLPLHERPSFSRAMVTRGGVSLREVSPKTMESRIVPGLYFAGEVLDIDGDTGGYNLQAAFSTGYIAGCAAATT